MEEIILRNHALDDTPLHVCYLPDKGMNMISYKKGGREVIDQSTTDLFVERYAGLGALIGPHFHNRRKEILPHFGDSALFPHIATVAAKNPSKDPFSHGIARYAPWNFEATETTISAQLRGEDKWNGIFLKDIEGQDFTMKYDAALQPDGLHIELSVVSETDSLVGIHYYYHLPKNRGSVISGVQKKAIAVDQSTYALPPSWIQSAENQRVAIPLDDDIDLTFHPFPDPTKGEVVLDAVDYKLKTTFSSTNEECCFQLWHPKSASFVCIEPISANNPRALHLSVSSIKIALEIL